MQAPITILVIGANSMNSIVIEARGLALMENRSWKEVSVELEESSFPVNIDEIQRDARVYIENAARRQYEQRVITSVVHSVAIIGVKHG